LVAVMPLCLIFAQDLVALRPLFPVKPALFLALYLIHPPFHLQSRLQFPQTVLVKALLKAPVFPQIYP
jgi:hypothetical protein